MTRLFVTQRRCLDSIVIDGFLVRGILAILKEISPEESLAGATASRKKKLKYPEDIQQALFDLEVSFTANVCATIDATNEAK
jgi:hypothetical protein